MKKRVHKFEVSVTFNVACNKSQALSEIRDAIYKGEHYGNGIAYGDANVNRLTLQTVKHKKEAAKAPERVSHYKDEITYMPIYKIHGVLCTVTVRAAHLGGGWQFDRLDSGTLWHIGEVDYDWQQHKVGYVTRTETVDDTVFMHPQQEHSVTSREETVS